MCRPFYGEYAWAYDLLITTPVERHCAAMAELFSRRGVEAGAKILDAGCGTGRYALELTRRGYHVAGLDLSTALLALARARVREAGLCVPLTRGSILDLPFAATFDGLLCRGVLNDLLEDRSRREVFASFAGALRRGGVLIFDVRDWGETVGRKTREPVFEKTVDTPRGRLAFRSETRLDHARHRLLVTERHVFDDGAGETIAVHEFVMRCWTREELQRRLTAAGFDRIAYLGGYDLTAPAGASDRVVCVASRA